MPAARKPKPPTGGAKKATSRAASVKRSNSSSRYKTYSKTEGQESNFLANNVYDNKKRKAVPMKRKDRVEGMGEMWGEPGKGPMHRSKPYPKNAATARKVASRSAAKTTADGPTRKAAAKKK